MVIMIDFLLFLRNILIQQSLYLSYHNGVSDILGLVCQHQGWLAFGIHALQDFVHFERCFFFFFFCDFPKPIFNISIFPSY